MFSAEPPKSAKEQQQEQTQQRISAVQSFGIFVITCCIIAGGNRLFYLDTMFSTSTKDHKL